MSQLPTLIPASISADDAWSVAQVLSAAAVEWTLEALMEEGEVDAQIVVDRFRCSLEAIVAHFAVVAVGGSAVIVSPLF